jgi:hypothetical protein
MSRGCVIEAKINRGHKLPVLPDKWIKDNENGSKYGTWKGNENFR